MSDLFVSVDENEKRRDIVRKKTAKYLMKAESLHIKYLAGGESTDHWDVSYCVSIERSRDHNEELSHSFCLRPCKKNIYFNFFKS